MPVTVEMRPVRTPGITLLDMGSEAMLEDRGAHAVHVLNQTARLIWEACDGEHTIADIEAAIRAWASVPEGRDIVPDIERTLRTFIDKGLVSL